MRKSADAQALWTFASTEKVLRVYVLAQSLEKSLHVGTFPSGSESLCISVSALVKTVSDQLINNLGNVVRKNTHNS